MRINPKNKNALYFYACKQNVKLTEIARANGIARQTINEKMNRNIYTLSLKTYAQVAKAVNKPIDEVVRETLAIDKTLKDNEAL